jgi:multiple sugar transport system permease protein
MKALDLVSHLSRAFSKTKVTAMSTVISDTKLMGAHQQRSWQSKRRLFPWLLVAPCLSVLILVGLVPLLYVLVLSVTDYSFAKPLKFVGIDHFMQAFADTRFWQGMRVTMWFVSFSVAIQLVLAMIVAWALTRINNVFRHVSLTIIMMPMLLSPTLTGLIWKMLLKARFGAFDYFIEQLGVRGIDWLANPQMALLGVTIADVWQWTPFMALILFAGIQSLSQEIHEASYVDGASMWQSFYYITLPLLKPFILLAVFLRMIDAFKTFDLIWGITKGGPGSSTESIALYTHKVGFTAFELSYAAAISLLQLVVIIFLGKMVLNQLNQANQTARNATIEN